MSYSTSHPAITANLPERDEYLASENIANNKYTEIVEKLWNESWLPGFGPESPLFEKQKDTSWSWVNEQAEGDILTAQKKHTLIINSIYNICLIAANNNAIALKTKYQNKSAKELFDLALNIDAAPFQRIFTNSLDTEQTINPLTTNNFSKTFKETLDLDQQLLDLSTKELVLQITVNTSEDRSLEEENRLDPSNTKTSLREAIHIANELTYAGPFNRQKPLSRIYINFENAEQKSWHFQPTSALPALNQAHDLDIYINHGNPKNITIDGSLIKSSGGRTYSLLTLGDYQKISSTSNENQTIHIKNVNLVNNTAQAEHGSNGGGGGLAAGAGISILHGDAKLENIVFQNLKAIGGNGSIAPSGAKGAYQYYREAVCASVDGFGGCTWDAGWYNNTSMEIGKTGGSGGRPTLLGANLGSSGGAGGKAGTTQKGGTAGAQGGHGGNGKFGVGGGGGGGGGGGAVIDGNKCSWIEFWCTETADIPGDGGHGGNGGQGGFGAGGGSGGTAGENALGKGRSQPGGNSGAGGSVHKNNQGDKGANSHNSDGSTVSTGNSGGPGDALGASLAILNPYSNVELINIDFVGSRAESKSSKYNNFYTINADNREGIVSGASIYTFASADASDGTKLPANALVNNQDYYAKITAKTSEDEPQNIHQATSFNRVKSLAKIRDSRIVHRPGSADITTINAERPGSTLRDIDIDSSALENSINDIYKRLLPVEDEDKIQNRFKEKIISAAFSAASGGYASYSNAGNFFKASENKYDASSKSTAIKFGVAGAALGFVTSLWSAHSEYQNEITQNRRNLSELTKLQKEDRGVTAGPIDIGQSRSIITIENFTLGEDILYLNDFWGNELQDASPIIRNGMGRKDNEKVDAFEIHIKTGDNSPTKVAEVQLDPESIRILNSSLQTDAVGYIQALLKANPQQQRWEIDTTLTDKHRIFQKSPYYTGGPAGEVVIIDRQSLNDLSNDWSTTTFNYNDSITGSEGTEKINTNGGNDFIAPGFGKDTVNGGESIDWVSLTDLKEPITATGKSITNDLNQSINTIEISNKNYLNKTKVLESTLQNIEVVSSFGPSSFDFKTAPQPNPLALANVTDSLSGFYTIRSGSGSNIVGSQYDDQFIISMMPDENLANYLDSTDTELQQNYKILQQVSVISGEAGDNKLAFAFSEIAPELKIFNLGDESEYPGYQAIADSNSKTIIALIKGFDESNISSLQESEQQVAAPIFVNSDGLNYSFESDPNLIIEGSNNNFIEQTEEDLGQSLDQAFPLSHSSASITFASFDAMEEPFDVMGNTFSVTNDGNKGPLVIQKNKKKNRIIGTPYDDILMGSKSSEKFLGSSGDDLIFGKGGKNIILPGRGNDQIFLHKKGLQIIQNFNAKKDKLVFPGNWKTQEIEINENDVFYLDKLIAKLEQ